MRRISIIIHLLSELKINSDADIMASGQPGCSSELLGSFGYHWMGNGHRRMTVMTAVRPVQCGREIIADHLPYFGRELG
jgi:hypothetical protein